MKGETSEFYIKGPPDKVQLVLNRQFTRLAIVEFFQRTDETWELNVEVPTEEVDDFTDKCDAEGVEVKLV
jgi:hypothetical protein